MICSRLGYDGVDDNVLRLEGLPDGERVGHGILGPRNGVGGVGEQGGQWLARDNAVAGTNSQHDASRSLHLSLIHI